MKRPDTIIIEGRAYSWRAILELRRRQIEEWKKSRPVQPVLFDLKEDRRPHSERSPAGRYCEPTLLSWLNETSE